jgi:hypothetical protein
MNVVTYACVSCIEKNQRIRELEAEVDRLKAGGRAEDGRV